MKFLKQFCNDIVQVIIWMLNQEQLQTLLKPRGNQCIPINLPNLRALLTWPLIRSMALNILSPKAVGLLAWILCGIHLSYVFPLNTYTTKHISQTHRSLPDSANRKRQQREGLSEAGRHTHFLRTSNQGPWDAAGAFSKTHKMPHPARTWQTLKALRGTNLLVHQYTHPKLFFFPKAGVTDFP